jgi:mannose-1-phosphate guanylyltransferase
MVNGDVLTDLDVRQLVRVHERRAARATIHLTAVDDPSAFGVADVAPDGRVERFVEKPAPDAAPSNLVNAGTYVLEPDVLDLVPAGGPTSIERETFPSLAAEGTLYAVATDDYWLDTGRPELYRRANLDVVGGARSWITAEAVAAGAQVAADAVVERSVIAGTAVVGAGARIAGSVVLDRCRIEAGAEVVDSVLGPGATVGAGAALADVVLGAGAAVEPNERLAGARRPEPT